MSAPRTYIFAALLPVFSACAGSGGSQTPNPYTGPITAAELKGTGARDAYEAVQRLRPRWLVVRGMRSFSIETEVVVFQERLYLGNQDELRRIGLDGIYSIEYMDGSTAQATLPGLRDRHIQGAIIVHMSPPAGGGGGGSPN